jgi:hypothetical protein
MQAKGVMHARCYPVPGIELGGLESFGRQSPEHLEKRSCGGVDNLETEWNTRNLEYVAVPRNHPKEHNIRASDAPFGSLFFLENILGHISKLLLDNAPPAPPRPIDIVFHGCYIPSMEWAIEFTDEFERWWNDLSEDEQDSVDQMVRLLQMRGPSLGRPHADLIQSSRHSNMKELRVQHAGRPYRVLFAFDPTRCAILLTGGDKTGNDRWYEEFVPIADRLYAGTFGSP